MTRRGARVEIVAGCESAASCGQLSVLHEALDEEAGGHGGFGVGVVSLRSRFGGLGRRSFHSLARHRAVACLSVWLGSAWSWVRPVRSDCNFRSRAARFCGALRRACGRVKRG